MNKFMYLPNCLILILEMLEEWMPKREFKCRFTSRESDTSEVWCFTQKYPGLITRKNPTHISKFRKSLCHLVESARINFINLNH